MHRRYVDDIFLVVQEKDKDPLLDTINNLHKDLSFTVEKEDHEGILAFLDMRLEHRMDKIHCSWHKKALMLVSC